MWFIFMCFSHLQINKCFVSCHVGPAHPLSHAGPTHSLVHLFPEDLVNWNALRSCFLQHTIQSMGADIKSKSRLTWLLPYLLVFVKFDDPYWSRQCKAGFLLVNVIFISPQPDWSTHGQHRS